MQNFRNASRVTFGCVMAKARNNASENSTEYLKGGVKLSFCYTDDDSNGLKVTSQMRELTNSGYFLVGIAQFDVNDPFKSTVWMSRLTSERIGSAFVSTVRDLVDSALYDLVANRSSDAGRIR
jgi:hypothetical protein